MLLKWTSGKVMFLQMNSQKTNLRVQISMTNVKANYSLFLNFVEVMLRWRGKVEECIVGNEPLDDDSWIGGKNEMNKEDELF